MSRQNGRNTKHYSIQLQAAVLALALSAAMTPSRARAADITIDAGEVCTLAEAITSANDDNAAGNGCVDGSGADTINLKKDVTLDAALPDITTEITIEGAGHTIDGNILRITSSGNLALNEATISGILITGSISHGISSSSITLNSSTISGNTGSGIFSSFSSVTVNNSTISGNGGDGIASDSSFVTVNNSTISGNGGSGITGKGWGRSDDFLIAVNNSTISGNGWCGIASVSYSSSASVTVNNSTISGNSWCGIASVSQSALASVTVNNSTISGNTGSGIASVSYSYSSATVNNSTITGNTGSGIASYSYYSYSSSSVTLKNSLISGNTGSSANEINSCATGCTITAAASNLFGHSGESNAEAFSGFIPVHDSDFIATNDGGTPTALADILDPTLADNGGPTLTYSLPAGSPAIDLDPICTTGLPQDQRGSIRPVGAGCDAGSFESDNKPQRQAMPWLFLLLNQR